MALDLLVTILSFVLPVCALILIFSMGKAMFNLAEVLDGPQARGAERLKLFDQINGPHEVVRFISSFLNASVGVWNPRHFRGVAFMRS